MPGHVTMTVGILKLFSDNRQIILINTIENSHRLKRLRLCGPHHCFVVISHTHQFRHCDFPVPPNVIFLVHFLSMFF